MINTVDPILPELIRDASGMGVAICRPPGSYEAAATARRIVRAFDLLRRLEGPLYLHAMGAPDLAPLLDEVRQINREAEG